MMLVSFRQPLSSFRRNRVTFRGFLFLWFIAFSFSYASPAQQSWMGTWATAQMPVKPVRDLLHITVRQIVHTSLGGSRARLRFTNTFGTESVEIRDVHIALPNADSSSVMAGSGHEVRFAGKTDVTIAPGALAVSDPVDFAVPAGADIDVSFYLPSFRGVLTGHDNEHQTSYLASGDASSRPDLTAALPFGGSYFLAGVDVDAPLTAAAVVTLGASITEGHVTTQNTNRRWPNFLFQRLQAAHKSIAVLNLAISGNRLIAGGAGPTAEERFERDVLHQPGVQWVIFADAPVNDLNSADPPSAERLIAAMQRLMDRAHRQHIRFVCSTLTPFEGTKEWTPQREAERQQVNNFVRSASSGCDGVVDQDVATHDPAHPTRFLPAFDHGDHLHPNEAGMQAITSAVDLRIFQIKMASKKQ